VAEEAELGRKRVSFLIKAEAKGSRRINLNKKLRVGGPNSDSGGRLWVDTVRRI
jgi:hypothetical protein